MAIRRIAGPACATMVNAQCRHSSSGRDCEFFVAFTLMEEIQQVSAVNKRPPRTVCCGAATKHLSNTLFSVLISGRQRKEVSHGTHTFLECSDDQCSVPLHRNDDLHLKRNKRSPGGQGRQNNKRPCRNEFMKDAWPRRRRHAFSFRAGVARQAAAPAARLRSILAKPTRSQTAETSVARFIV